MSKPVCTTCPYCGVGCGVLATPRADGGADIVGDPAHPANFGKLCSKGAALGETLSLGDRLLYPEIAGERVSWEAALDAVAAGFRDAVAADGPDAVALYVSGQLLTEDYYVANKLAKGFLGTGNIDTNSRLCMASSVAGHSRAFGSDTVPGSYEDLDQADLVVLVGSNFAWCHPVLHQRLLAARAQRGTRIVVIDPRRTATAEDADMHLAIAPGSDVALFNGLFAHLAARDVRDEAFVDAHTSGLDAAHEAARETDTAAITGLDPLRLRRFYDLFADTRRVVTVYSQGVNQSSAGTDKVNAIINCHLLTGRIGRAGMGPFSITGQPNAMGGREVGGLANQLAAHMSFEDPADRDRVARFWGVERVAPHEGLKAVDLFRAVADGRIKALWIMATNPAASLPEAGLVEEALKKCPLTVVSDVTATTKTARLANILLPALGWGEKDGTVTNSERRISRQRAFLPPAGEARADWWALAEVARRMGFKGFDYEGPAAIFREHAALSAFENEGGRDFDLGALEAVSDDDYGSLAPVQWPVPKTKPTGTDRLFANGGFFTGDRRARFIATPFRAPVSRVTEAAPLVLNTGRIRDQWHTMTRTGKAARLTAHLAEPFAELHPADAAALGIEPADLVRVSTDAASITVRALITDRQKQGSVFVPMHWTEPYAAGSSPDALVAGNVDPVSGQPELKHTPVRVERSQVPLQAYLVCVAEPQLAGLPYGAKARVAEGWRAEMAFGVVPDDMEETVRRLLCVPEGLDLVSFRDGRKFRAAAFEGDRLIGAFLSAPGPVAAARDWMIARLGRPLDGTARLRLLAGRPGADMPDKGALICSCHEVGANEIEAAIGAGARTVEAVGDTLKAGTNCGSCRSDIRRLLEMHHVKRAV